MGGCKALPRRRVSLIARSYWTPEGCVISLWDCSIACVQFVLAGYIRSRYILCGRITSCVSGTALCSGVVQPKESVTRINITAIFALSFIFYNFVLRKCYVIGMNIPFKRF
jgi:hypothetical protein